METNRQKKIAGVLQKDLVNVLQNAAQEGMKGVIISVTKVNVTADLSVAKVYLKTNVSLDCLSDLKLRIPTQTSH